MPKHVKRLRAGLYDITDHAGRVWEVEQREVDPAWGGGLAWFATCDRDALDPLQTLREVKRALSTP